MVGTAVPLTATVVLCTKDRPALLGPTMDALAVAVRAAPGTEVVVVEQGGTPAVGVVREHGFRHLADLGVGVSRARNLGIRAATGDVVLFTDDDCLVPPSWISGHLAVLDAPSVQGSFGEVGGLPRHEDDGTDGARTVARHGRGSPPWDVGHSSNMAVRRAVLLAVGGFDERIGPGARGIQAGEDADLIARLLRAGHALASGTGDPVRHADWRTEDEDLATLLAYELGAGVWIGAALRARDPSAGRHLRSRVRMLWPRVAQQVRTGRARDGVRLWLGLARGLGRGLFLRPWSGGT